MTTSRPVPSRTNTPAAAMAPDAAPTPGLGRRRSVPHLLLGAVLVVACAVAFASTALRVDPRIGVLALARDVPAGHVLSDADVRVVRIVADAAMSTVAESRKESILGRSARLPLAAGGLLSESTLGPGAWPPAGQAVVAVKVTAGHAPASVDAGTRVLVLIVPTSAGNAAAGSAERAVTVRAEAAVVAAEAPDTSGARVVSLLMADADAVRVAGAAGEASLVVRGRAG